MVHCVSVSGGPSAMPRLKRLNKVSAALHFISARRGWGWAWASRNIAAPHGGQFAPEPSRDGLPVSLRLPRLLRAGYVGWPRALSRSGQARISVNSAAA